MWLQAQLLFIPTYFLAAFSYFLFFTSACEFQGQAEVKCCHFSDEMQADVASLHDILHTLPVFFAVWGGI